MFTLSQTVAGTWVITTPNPEERHCSTQIAEFDTTSAIPGTTAHSAIEQGAAATLAVLVLSFCGDPDDEEHVAELYSITSHDMTAITRMRAKVQRELAASAR
tara:strand:- start:897 stop:1202 length:306 start_codon:yes stop_codon:yes gene_type:complete